MMEKTCKWTVFIAYDILETDKGYLYGTISESNNNICILSTSPSNCEQKSKQTLLGTWNLFPNNRWSIDLKNIYGSRNLSLDIYINLSKNSEDLIKCELQIKDRTVCCTCVLYNVEEFQTSYIFMEKANFVGNTCSNNVCNQIKHSVFDEVYMSLSIVKPKQPTLWYLCFEQIFRILKLILTLSGVFCISGLFLQAATKLYQGYPWLCKSLNNVCSISQLYRRAKFLASLTKYYQYSPIEKLRIQNQIWSQLLDCVIGVSLLLLFWHFNIYSQLLVYTAHWTNIVAGNLTDLIHWLMGAPAGLKLNSHLTHLLGQIFLYHVYIWTGYMKLMQPVLTWIPFLAIPISILGLSFQISLLQDVISMLTLHIYCFYVYAARIYSVEISSVVALWRLFRGKKWNILRKRVDSASYDIDQLFFGTLMFTILLFLLPTILLYYSVFLTFRLLVLVFHGLLSWCVYNINNLQIYTIMAWILQSKSVAGDVIFNIVPDSPQEQYILLTLQACQLPLSALLQSTRRPQINKSFSTCSTLFTDIILGNLIFPWISPTNWKEKSE